VEAIDVHEEQRGHDGYQENRYNTQPDEKYPAHGTSAFTNFLAQLPARVL
jgi:hypothetical protein